jgi:hypothetical protein
MPRFDPTEFGRLLARRSCGRRRASFLMRASVPRPFLRSTRGPMPTARLRPVRAAEPTRAPVGVGPEREHSDGADRGAARRGQARSDTPLVRGHRPVLVVALARDMIEAPQPMSCRRGAEALGASRDSIWRWRMKIIGALTPEPDNSLAGIVEADEAHQRESRKGSREWVRHQRDPCEPAGTAAPEVASLSAQGWLGDSASGRLASLGEKDPRGNRPRRPPGVRGHCRRWLGGDLRCAAARDGARCGALHGRVRRLRADREGRTHPAFRTQCRAADEACPAQPPYKYRQHPDRPVPRIQAALLWASVKEPCSLRPMACRSRQRRPLLP